MTTLIEFLTLLLAFLGGLLAGLLYFGGLWLTLRHLLQSRHAPLFIMGGFFLRLALTLAIFFLASQADILRLLTCLGGFVLMRILLVRRCSPLAPTSTPDSPHERHA